MQHAIHHKRNAEAKEGGTMNWFDWVLIALIALGIINNIAIIGKEREPLQPFGVAVATIINAFLIVGIIIW